MEAESEWKFTYQQIYGYIKHGKYPETVQKDDKLALWKQSKFSKHRRCNQDHKNMLFPLSYWGPRRYGDPVPNSTSIWELPHRFRDPAVN